MTMGPTSPLEMGRGQVVPLGRSVGVSQRGMRPAGVVGPSRQVAPVGVLDVKGNSAVRPVSAEAVEFSPTPGPRTDVMAGRENVSSRAGGVAPAVVAHFPSPMGAGGGHFGCPKITFDLISNHFTSISNFNFLTTVDVGHFECPNFTFDLHFWPFQIDTQLL